MTLKDGPAYAIHESVRRTQLYVLASGNGLTADDIVEHDVVVPEAINTDVLHQLQMTKPPLFHRGLLESNFLLLPGTRDQVRILVQAVQEQLYLLEAWAANANHRSDFLLDAGQFSLWVHEELKDRTYQSDFDRLVAETSADQTE